ncbi:MAG TPA: hypothetical protein DCR98_08390, partial [Cobetia sp.]|nr:hypothetical protein [Cobetia sp.]
GEGDGDGDGDAKESAEGGETPAKKDEDGAGSGDPEVTVVQDDEQAFVVELQGVRFEPNRNQVREDGTLTAGGLKAFDEAKAAAEAAE